ncbi:hypothetical protein KYC5002_24265 [Archangium violaceum]|uniref:GspE/PulE/PilB domain-containing protein n=1 Tax=Archangium violaceum TaxID=83451 RepID=UPI002B297558|nr:hypothetical protein KYC5002_24265 [Archangium gephyra]
MADRPIQNCQVRFQFKCPKQWDSLRETAEPGVRLCGQCHKQVYLCQSTQEAAEHARAGHCVAVPAGLVPPAEPGILLHGRELDPDVIRLVPLEVCRRHGLIPVGRSGSSLVVAMSDPSNLNAIDDVKFLTGYDVDARLASPRDIQEALERAELETSDYVEMGVMVCEEPPEPDLFEGPVGKLIRRVLLDAHQKQEARIQVELIDSGMVIRYGLEGSQRDAMWVPFQLRLEVMRQLRHASRGIVDPKGQLHILMRGQRIDYQVRFNPTALGEEAVLQPVSR